MTGIGTLAAIGARGAVGDRIPWVISAPRVAASTSDPAATNQRAVRAVAVVVGGGRTISAATKVSGERPANPASGLMLKGEAGAGRMALMFEGTNDAADEGY